jgi:uridine kinase
MLINDVQDLTPTIVAQRSRIRPSESLLVAISGIDASGKGYMAARLADSLNNTGLSTITIGIDPWLGNPQLWYGKNNAGELFYRYGIRLADLFRTLILPLKQHRSITLPAILRRQVDSAEYTHVYEYHDVDVIIVEGIFLLKRAWRCHYDCSLWVECSLETSLERALQRNQEGLRPELIVRDYHNIYFPAQRIHFAVDHPRGSAGCVVLNDPRLQGLALGLGYEAALDIARRSGQRRRI